MGTHATRLAIGALAALALAASAAAQPVRDGRRIEVPVRIAYTAAGPLFSIPIRVGDSEPFEALLDTGSSGLRVAAGALRASAHRPAGRRTQIDTPSGVRYAGSVSTAVVSVEGLATPEPIAILLADRAACLPAAPDCPVRGAREAEFLPRAGERGYRAIAGIGLRALPANDGVLNPLAQLPGNSAFILAGANFGDAAATLILNPLPSDRTRFVLFRLESLPTRFRNGLAGWSDDRLPGCVTDPAARASLCAPTLLDTLSPAMRLMSGRFGERRGAVPAGTRLVFSVGERPGAYGQTEFTVGRTPRPGLDLVDVRPADPLAESIGAGVLPFFRFDILYDQRLGAIGFAARR